MYIKRSLHFTKIIVVLGSLLLAACSHNKPASGTALVFLSNEEPVSVNCLIPPLTANKHTIIHYVSGSYKDSSFYFDSIIKKGADELQIVASSSFSRLFSLRATPTSAPTIETFVPIVNMIQPDYMVMDLALIYLKADELRSCLPSSYVIDDQNLERTISYRGSPIVKIKYQNPTPYSGDVSLENILRDYRYTIKQEEAKE